MKLDFPRKLALEALVKIEEEKAYSNIVLDELLKTNRERLTQKDIGFISELIYGTITWKLTIDTIISKYSNTKIKKMSCYVIGILRLGAYQILFLDRVPKSAAVNEAVNLAKKYAGKSAGLINAVLRKIKKEDLEELKTIQNTAERISKTTSMPEWIVEELLKEKTDDEVEKICYQSNQKPNMAIRLNRLKIEKEKLIQKLEEVKVQWKEGHLDDFIYLENQKDITNFALYQEGYFTLQDESAGLAPILLDPKAGEHVLDACSAPGGKTTYLAELMQNQGKILAWDLYEERVKQIENQASRLQIQIIQTKQTDSSQMQEEYIEKFDKVLLDVPCLGLGVTRRKPDIKWQRQKEEIKSITKIQKQILETCSNYVKKGGFLLYSTCSILAEENEKITEDFLKEHPEFELEKIEEKIPVYFKQYLTKKGDLKIYPSITQDGFYLCLLRKRV